jgi:hypothetical protein
MERPGGFYRQRSVSIVLPLAGPLIAFVLLTVIARLDVPRGVQTGAFYFASAFTCATGNGLRRADMSSRKNLGYLLVSPDLNC